MAKNASPGLVVATACLVFAYLGFDLTMNLVHYASWAFVGPAEFETFRDESTGWVLILVAVLTLPLLALSLYLVVRPPRRVPRWTTVLALVLTLVPLVATGAYIVPGPQDTLGEEGPTAENVDALVQADLWLRVVPIVLQAALVAWFLVRQFGPPTQPTTAAAPPAARPSR